MAASVKDGSDGGERRAGSILESLASVVPVQVVLKDLVVGRVKLGTLLALGKRGTVVTTGNLDVEGLGPDLPVGDGTVVVDGGNLSAEHVVS